MSRQSITALGALGALAILAAGLVLAWSALTTSSARVAATTSGGSFFSAGEVELTQPESAVDLLFDASGLYPGVELDGCVEIRYDGSIPASVRAHGMERKGTGLAAFIEMRLTLDPGGDCDSTTPSEAAVITYDGRLQSLFGRHGSYADGIVLSPAARPSDVFAVWATATLTDDNRAQGLESNFSLIIEARP